tara:strand:- start:74 stop:799 length:726 start_codon:yes stop_codon:yes gene_type:complete
MFQNNLLMAAAGAGGYTIKNSCTFNGSDEWMNRTWDAPTVHEVWSFSCWIERDGLGVNDGMFGPDIVSSKNGQILVNSSNQLDLYNDNAALIQARITSTTVDTSWTHILATYDLSASTPIHLYLDGTEASYSSTLDQGGSDFAINRASSVHNVGRETSGPDTYMSGQMAEVVFIDGLVISVASVYDGGKAVDPSGLTFGNDGFHFNFEDSSDMGKDVSGNSNDFSLNNIDSGNQSTNVPPQ